MSFNICQWSLVSAGAAPSSAAIMPAFAPHVATSSDSFVWALQNQTMPGPVRNPFLLPQGGERYYSGLLARVSSGALVLGVAAYLGGGHEAIGEAMVKLFGGVDKYLWGGELFCASQDGGAQGVARRFNETSGFLQRQKGVNPHIVDDMLFPETALLDRPDDADKKARLLSYPDSYERLLKLCAKAKETDPTLAEKLSGLIPLEELRALEGDALHSALSAMGEVAVFLRGQLRAPADGFKWVSPNGIAEILTMLTGGHLLPFPVSSDTEYVPFSPDNQHLDPRLNNLLKKKDNVRHMAGNQIAHVRLALAASNTSEQKREELLQSSGPYNLLYAIRETLERDDPDVLGMLDGLISIDKLRGLEGEELTRAIESLDRSFDFLNDQLSTLNPTGTYHLFEISSDHLSR